ncbi:MAG: sporulation protein Cse60 [Oscillospiraceae bacterium]|nr:sporulation protein Cse60 [Oscillospiraceae bacterium]
MKVKIFTKHSSQRLQWEINNFIDDVVKNKKSKIIDIKYSHTIYIASSINESFSAMVIYKENGNDR